MSAYTLVVIAFVLGLAAMSFAFGGGAVIVALTVTAIAIVAFGVLDLRRRRKQARDLQEFRGQASAKNIEFSERDKETLTSE